MFVCKYVCIICVHITGKFSNTTHNKQKNSLVMTATNVNTAATATAAGIFGAGNIITNISIWNISKLERYTRGGCIPMSSSPPVQPLGSVPPTRSSVKALVGECWLCACYAM